MATVKNITYYFLIFFDNARDELRASSLFKCRSAAL